jgi:hypothetical protein
MAESFQVCLNINSKIVFPQKCVVCKKTCYDYLSIRGNPDINFWFGGWKWLLRLTKKIDVCCHQACGKKIKISLLRRNYLLFIVAASALAITIYLFGIGYQRSLGELIFSRFFLILLAFLLLMLPLIWQDRHPAIFEFVLNDDTIEFTFKDREYAKEFALLNKTKIKE